MKQMSILFVLLFFVTACVPAVPTQIPAGTLVALTLAALPHTATFTPAPPSTPTPGALQPVAGQASPAAPAAAACIPANTPQTRALATRILSGDTIEVVIDGAMYSVRYIGIDAPGIVPEIEWQGPQAIAANDRLVNGQFVTLIQDVQDVDEEGFLLRYVVLNNLFINYELVRQGFALAASMPPNVACDAILLQGQIEAQAAVFGVWMPTPIPSATITSTPTITPFPTVTRVPVCDCKGPALTCNNFPTQAQAQACYEYCKAEGYGDIFNLDKNGNGKACEGSS